MKKIRGFYPDYPGWEIDSIILQNILNAANRGLITEKGKKIRLVWTEKKGKKEKVVRTALLGGDQ